MTGEVTQAEQVVTPPMTIEQQAELYVCGESIRAARSVVGPLLEDFTAPADDSVQQAVIRARKAQLPVSAQLGEADLLLNDPAKSGTVVERHRQQDGSLPHDTVPKTVEQALVQWTVEVKAEDIPDLKIPEGKEEALMALADKAQMRGGGPIIYAREEADRIPVAEETIVHIHGGGMRALIERLDSALALEAYKGPILATVKPSRVLPAKEREAVAGFAPNARNEYGLMIASARHRGFEVVHEADGVRFLEDGSVYQVMAHPKTGRQLVVLAPAIVSDTNGVVNAYTTMHNQGRRIVNEQGESIFGSDFDLQGRRVVAVTGTHYGPQAIMNNLKATRGLGVKLGSVHVLGDNQPITKRKPHAHLVEIGLTLQRFRKAIEDPLQRYALLGEVA